MLRSSLALGLAFVTLATGHAAPPAASVKCPASEFRQFDFWLGDWDTFEVAGNTATSIARARVDLIAGGCAVHELYELPARSPDLNAYAERFVLSIKSECLRNIIPLGECHLRRAVAEFVAHYHVERNHQGLDNRLVVAPVEPAPGNGPVVRRERLGGLLNFYYRRAA